MSSLEMEESPGEGKLEMAFLFARRLLITWPVGRRHHLDNRDFKGKEREQILLSLPFYSVQAPTQVRAIFFTQSTYTKLFGKHLHRHNQKQYFTSYIGIP